MKIVRAHSKRLYHYTVGVHLQSILDTGAILPADLYLEPNEIPAVWFSANPLMEPTARKGCSEGGVHRTLSMEETRQRCGGLYRFQLSPEVLTCDMTGYRDLSGITAWGFKKLVQSGRRQGANPQDWRVIFDSVGLDDIASLEQWSGSAWVLIYPQGKEEGPEPPSPPTSQWWTAMAQ